MTWARIQEIRPGIRSGELVTAEQEAMLAFLGIDHDALRDSMPHETAVGVVQHKISGKALAYRRSGRLA